MITVGIDVATITPGKGGSGGGIWIYAKNVLSLLDELLANEPDLSIKVFVNSSFDLTLNHIQIVPVNTKTGGLLNRMRYVNVKLPSLCRQYQVDVLHKLATEVPLFYRGKMVVMIHDLIIGFYLKHKYYGNNLIQWLKLRYFKYIEKVAVKNSKVVFTNSQALKDELITLYGNNHVVVSGCGISIQENQILPRVKKHPLQLYCVAGFYSHKGHAYVIKLFELLIQKHHLDVVLHFRGNPNEKNYFDSIVDLVKRSSFKERIFIDAYQKQHALRDIYSNASAMILLSEYEGFGLPIIEAQALGVPVICSDIPVFREVTGGYACFVDLNDLNAGSDKVNDFLRDEDKQKFNIEQSLENVKRFNWGKIAAEILEVYKSI